jgi:anti-sigma B factor antagonist
VAAWGPSIVVDLAGLDFIYCCGMGVLVRVLKRIRENGGDMSLAAPQQRVRMVLSITGLIDVFSVHPSLEQAVIAYEAARRRQPAGAAAALAAVH